MYWTKEKNERVGTKNATSYGEKRKENSELFVVHPLLFIFVSSSSTGRIQKEIAVKSKIRVRRFQSLSLNEVFFRKMMHSNRHVLRATHNRLPLQDVSSEKTLISQKPKLWPNTVFQQQENRFAPTSRPILTATRSIKKLLQDNPLHDEENAMLVSPQVNTNKLMPLDKQTVSEENKTREQLEQELFEL